MTRIIWAPQAIEDVEAIRAYVARDSPHYADLVVERIVAAVALLESSPRSGRVVPEVGDESLREVIHGNYRIVYRFRHDFMRLRPCFTAPACFGWSEAAVARASNFPMNPPPASPCSAAAGYRGRSTDENRAPGDGD